MASKFGGPDKNPQSVALTGGIDQGFLSEDQLFEALARSAFEFLEQALAEFSSSAKLSTVHFAIAIELFLKARLMREHWSLLLEKPDQADKAAFFKGDAKTASVDQTIERLRRIAVVTVPEKTRDIFAKIAKHRNKMVHFAHSVEAPTVGPAAMQAIAEEQCAGWLALRTLLNDWDEFANFKNEIWHVSSLMKGHKVFLEKTFEAKTEELKAHGVAGGKVVTCPSCDFVASKVTPWIGSIASTECVVCGLNGTELTVECPNDECSQSFSFTSYDGPPGECPHCAAPLSKEDVKDALDTGPAVTKDTYFDHHDINCPYCSGYHTVIEHHALYVCSECYESSEEMGICGYCSEGQLGGLPEHSYLSGCEFCEGAVGSRSDD